LKCVIAAQKIIGYLEERNRTASIKWSVRIGIHSGPITAGVIGKKKFSYDLFGDTINIASRIESASEPGRINVSAFTHRLIKEDFACTYRGKINAKGKGELDMYFVD
jgi:class 3 adenylate cyclase